MPVSKYPITLSRLILFIILAAILSSAFFYISISRAKPIPFYSNLDVPAVQQQDYTHCLILEKDKVVQVINNNRVSYPYSELLSRLKASEEQVKSKKLTIICTKDAEYNRITSVLDVVSALSIMDYSMVKS